MWPHWHLCTVLGPHVFIYGFWFLSVTSFSLLWFVVKGLNGLHYTSFACCMVCLPFINSCSCYIEGALAGLLKLLPCPLKIFTSHLPELYILTLFALGFSVFSGVPPGPTPFNATFVTGALFRIPFNLNIFFSKSFVAHHIWHLEVVWWSICYVIEKGKNFPFSATKCFS